VRVALEFFVVKITFKLTFREKLEWLEEAETLTLQFQANRGDRTKREIAL